jgi:hypothetical protein
MVGGSESYIRLRSSSSSLVDEDPVGCRAGWVVAEGGGYDVVWGLAVAGDDDGGGSCEDGE